MPSTFYFDLGSPYAYLAAERVVRVLPRPPVWQPILLGALFRRLGTGSWALTPARQANVAEIERRAAAYGLPALRWPEPFPGNTLFAMRVATYAGTAGAAETFALAAFRRAFGAGEDLTRPEVVLAAARDAGLDPEAARAGAVSDATKRALREASERAGDLGVRGVPTVAVGGALFFGDDRLEDAARAAAGG